MSRLAADLDALTKNLDSSKPWDKRAETFKLIQNYVKANRDETWTPECFRSLTPALKEQVADLRSQITRCACETIQIFSETLGNQFAPCAEVLFTPILIQGASGNVVISKYSRHCCKVIIQNVCIPKAVNILLKQVKTHKSQDVRDSCLEYTYVILNNWDISVIDSLIDTITDIIIAGLHDAGKDARYFARCCYAILAKNWRKNALKIYNSCDDRKKILLDRAIEDLDSSSAGSISEGSNNRKNSISGIPKIVPKSAMKIGASVSNSSGGSGSGERGGGGGGSSTHRVSGDTIQRATISSPYYRSSNHSSPFNSSDQDKKSPSRKYYTPYKKMSRTTPPTVTSSSSSSSNISNSAPNPKPVQSTNNSSYIDEDEDTITEMPVFSSHSNKRMQAEPGKRDSVRDILLHLIGQDRLSFESLTPLVNELANNANLNTNNKSNPVLPPPIPPAPSQQPLTTISSGSSVQSSSGDGFSGTSPSSSLNSNKFNVGDRVICNLKTGKLNAYIRFIGKTQFGSGIWIGVELINGDGKNDGEIQGVRYFQCPEKKGLFLRPTMIEKDLSASVPPVPLIPANSGTPSLPQPQTSVERNNNFNFLLPVLHDHKTSIETLMVLLNEEKELVNYIQENVSDLTPDLVDEYLEYSESYINVRKKECNSLLTKIKTLRTDLDL